MDESEKLERELEEEMRLARVPQAVRSHWKGCKACSRPFSDCDHGSRYRPQPSKAALSPCANWRRSELKSLEE